MKSTLQNVKDTKPVPSYPCLKRYNSNGADFVVFFTEALRGIVVWSGNAKRKVGYESGGWSEEDFVQFDGEVVLGM